MRDGMFFGALRARALSFAAGAAMVMVLAPAASAQFETGFEAPTYTGSADGTLLTGQDGWNLPSGIDMFVYTYTDNVLGFAVNPTGGDQFDAGVSQGGTNLARGQHDVDFSASGEWEFGYDLALQYVGQLPVTPNASSFSLQPSTTNRSFISLNNFEDVNNPISWKAEYNVDAQDGTDLLNQSPGAAWTGLAVNHWYRIVTKVNFDTNLITGVSITDLETGTTTEATPEGWYLAGANVGQPLPTAIRCFAGGSTAGSEAAYDNVSAKPAGAPPCPPDLNGDGTLDLFDFLAFTNLFNAQDPGADWNNDGLFDLFDFLGFVNSFNAGC